jgi:hypothetical protein
VRARYPPPTTEPAWEPHPPLLASAPPRTLSFRQHGIRAVVWATGWLTDLSWLQINEIRQTLDPGGFPNSCETAVDGFYWLGFDGLRTCASGTVAGFHLDAAHIATRLRRGTGQKPRHVTTSMSSSEIPSSGPLPPTMPTPPITSSPVSPQETGTRPADHRHPRPFDSARVNGSLHIADVSAPWVAAERPSTAITR